MVEFPTWGAPWACLQDVDSQLWGIFVDADQASVSEIPVGLIPRAELELKQENILRVLMGNGGGHHGGTLDKGFEGYFFFYRWKISLKSDWMATKMLVWI